MKQLFLLLFLFWQLTAGGQTSRSFTFTQADADSVKHIAQKLNFNGSLFIVQHGKTVLEWNHGFANKEQELINSSLIRFNIGSIGKSITSVLIMKLVEQGKMDLKQTIAHHLPGTSIANCHSITIRQLLNMTSGLGDYFTEPAFNENQAINNKLIFQVVEQMKPVNDTPGLHLNYSNAGFIVLGEILERSYQKTYQQIVWEQLLKPAGIVNHAKGYVSGYELKDGQWIKSVSGNNPEAWSAAGGLFLSSDELYKLVRFILTGQYISKQTLEQMWNKESHPEMDPPFVHYGLGWMVEDPAGVLLRGHNGGIGGFQSSFRYLPQDDLYFSFLSNYGNSVDELFLQVVIYLMHRKGLKLF